MSASIDGGPAFPRPGIPTNWAEGHHAHVGMTLRDWFAGQALQGLRSRDLSGAGESARGMNMHHNHADVCRMDGASTRLSRIAYEDADAMLAERAKKS